MQQTNQNQPQLNESDRMLNKHFESFEKLPQELRQQQEILTEKYLSQVQELVHLGFWVFSVAEQKASWSEEAFHIFGIDPAAGEPTYQDHRRSIHPDDWALFDSAVTRAVQEGIRYHLHLRILRQDDGQERHIITDCEVQRDELGNVAWLVGTVQDITEHSRLVEDLHEQKERYQAVVSQTAEAIFFYDVATRRIIEANPAFLKLFGYKQEEACNLLLYELIDDVKESIDEKTNAIILNGQYVSGERRYLRKDGTIVNVEASGALVTAGEFPVIAVVLHDITQRKKMEARLITSQKMTSLGTMAAGVAHEINSPLQAITGITRQLLQLIEEERISPQDLKNSLNIINRNSWRVAELSRSLLTYARFSTESFEKQDLNQIVQDSLLLFNIETSVETPAPLEIKLDLSNKLPLVECRRGQIMEAVVHLLENAKEAMPQGGSLGIKTSFNKDKNQLLLEISDTGGGISPAIQSRIFDPFFTTRPIGEGSGLGLAVVMGIAQAHHGDIKCRSQLTKGTTMIFSLPEKQPAGNSQPSGDNVLGRYGL